MKATKLKKAAAWMLQIVLAMIFLTVGMAKLSGVESTIKVFDQVGLGQWLRYVTGAVEVVSAILMLFGPYASLGAGMLVVTMAGAVMAHLWWLGGSILPPLGLGAAAAVLVYLRRLSGKARQLEEPEQPVERKSA